jgi:KDO2-lipid IV(A) lauroyltransferase
MLNKKKIQIRLILEFLIIYLIFLFIFFLPLNFISRLGAITFIIFGPLTKVQKIVNKNLLQIFPKANKKQLNFYAKKGWANTGKTFFELLVLSRIIKNKKKITIEGFKNINTVIQNKEKVIFIGIHQSNWEILLPSIDKLGIPVGGIYRHINNPYINKLVMNIRKKSISSDKSFYTPKGKKSAKDIIAGIKDKSSLVLLVDQKDSAGEKINFFNFPSMTQIGFIKIARKYNMKIIPIENIRDLNNNFTLKFHTPIEKLPDHNSDIQIMENINLIIEKWIKDNPTDWLLQHNRFS